MELQQAILVKNTERMIYMIDITFLSDDGSKKTNVLVGASWEFLNNQYKVPLVEIELQLNNWKKLIIEKWCALGDDIFKNDINYDIYANTIEGKANIANFLINESRK